MLDEARNTGTSYNHLKVDTFESAISTAKTLIDIISYTKELKFKSLSIYNDSQMDRDYLSVVHESDNDIDFYNNNIQDVCEYDPFYRGGFIVFSTENQRTVDIQCDYDDTNYNFNKLNRKVHSLDDIELSEEWYFQMSTTIEPNVLGIIFLFKYISLHYNECFYIDLATYRYVYNEYVEMQKI